VRIEVGGLDTVDAAARLWAEATAARDGGSVAPIELARPVIQSVLDVSPRSLLLVAFDGDDVCGFVAIAPSDADTAEVRYVGVSPRAWGTGVGRELMSAVPSSLAGTGYTRAVLLVYVDNVRAVRLYERLGWRAEGGPEPHPRSGKPEQRYVLEIP
jgi:ribosomal protein S18 acetylase RimI-like enzyme